MVHRAHYMVGLMEDCKLKLRRGTHNGIGAVRTIADDDIFAAGLFEIKAFLSLSGAVARILAFKSSLHRNSLLAALHTDYISVHLCGNLTHTVFVSAAGAD